MSKFLVSKYKNLEAYTPGEQPKKGEFLKLNTNENPFPPHERIKDEIIKYTNTLQLYSDNDCKKLTSTFANYYNIGEKNIIFANGSDEILAFCFLAFCDNSVCFPEISYGFYKVFAELFSVKGEKIPLDENFKVKPTDYFNKEKTIVIANPNAPTGIILSLNEIKGILENNKENVVIIDEAYIDFGGESAIQLTKEYNNLVVSGTFSKSRNLAGARLGYAVASEELISDLNKIKYSFNPYNVNTLTQVAGVVSLEENDYFIKCCNSIIENREKFVKDLDDLGFETLPSKANFVFTKSNKISGENLYNKLREEKIIVRHFTQSEISDYLRISIGTKENMDRLVSVIKKIIEVN